MDNWGLVRRYMSYLVHPNRKWRWKTLSVPVRKQLLSGKHVCSPQRNPLAVNTVLKANAVFLNADSLSLHSSPMTWENFACVLQSVLFHFNFYPTVVLIALFASVFYVNICLGIQNDGCMSLQVLADLQWRFLGSWADGVTHHRSSFRFKIAPRSILSNVCSIQAYLLTWNTGLKVKDYSQIDF